MTTSQPFKSDRHAALATEQTEHAQTARQIARILGRVPRTRRVKPHWLARVLRALWRAC
jgi:hypothetical protein